MTEKSESRGRAGVTQQTSMDQDAQMGNVRPGDSITVTALKSDGEPYRWWRAIVESVCESRMVTLTRIGDPVHGPGGGWTQRHHIRTFYWLNRPYNLMEVYEPDGRLKQIYIHIASAPIFYGHHLTYTDHELDVVRRHGQPVRVVDQDEFMAAAHRFGYSHEFQAACRKAVSEALTVCSRWRPLGPPSYCRKSGYRRDRNGRTAKTS